MKLHIGWSPGKLILSGEHAVVYGYPAIALPISLGIRIVLTEIDPNEQTQFPPVDNRLRTAWKKILPLKGIRVDMENDLPLGAGLGSSAAIGIATLRALASYQKIEPSFSWLFEQGFRFEKEFHGNPSGLDHAVCAAQKALYFRKEGPFLQEINFPSLAIVIMHSAEPKQTKTMVDSVRSQWPANANLLREIGSITEELANMNPLAMSAIGEKLTKNHCLLQSLGVSTPTLDKLVETAIQAGAFGAKLAGAGGGGIAFAIAENPHVIQSAIQNLGYECFCLHTHE